MKSNQLQLDQNHVDKSDKDKSDDDKSDDETQPCMSREENEDDDWMPVLPVDKEASSNPKDAAQKKKKKKKKFLQDDVDVEQPSMNNNNKDTDTDDDDSLTSPSRTCTSLLGRSRRYPHSRFVLKAAALFLLAIAVLAIALPVFTRQNRTNSATANSATDSNAQKEATISSSNDADADADADTTTPQFTASTNAPTTSPTEALTTEAPVPLCIDVSYQLNHLNWTAQDVIEERGNTLKTGLQIAAQIIAQEFVQSITTSSESETSNTVNPGQRRLRQSLLQLFHQQERNLLTTRPEIYPATVTNIVDISNFCATPNCLVVTQTVCVVYQPHIDAAIMTMSDVEEGLQKAVKEAIYSGSFIEKVPSQHLV